MSESFDWGLKSRPTSDDPSALGEAIEDFVGRSSNVTFVEIQNWLGPHFRGDCSVTDPRDSNLIYWRGVTQSVIDALNLLVRDNRIEFRTSSPLVYLFDGGALRLPIAKRPPRAGYRKPHWLPVVLNVPPASRTRR